MHANSIILRFLADWKQHSRHRGAGGLSQGADWRTEAGNIAPIAITIDLLTVVAMFVRNLLTLAIFAHKACDGRSRSSPYSDRGGCRTALGPTKQVRDVVEPPRLSSPLQLSKVLGCFY